MPRTLALLALAHGRSGDKGDAVNIGVIARRPEWYEFIRARLDAQTVARFLAGMADGPVVRYEMPNLQALNFLVEGALAGGGSVGLKIDAQGKTYAHAMLRFPIEVSDALFAEIERHFGGAIPPECFSPAAPPTPETGEEVLVAREGRIATISLNRPKRRNALTAPLLRLLARRIRECEAAGSRDKVIVLRGEGPGFCAGMDLTVLRGYGTDAARFHDVAEALCDVLAALVSSPLPVVCAVQGDAAGGGAALALASDITVFEEGSRFAMPETRIGFIPGMVSALAMRRMPAGAARELLLTGRGIAGADAYRLGIAHHLVADGTAQARARALAEEAVRANSAEAMARSKRLLAITSEAPLLAELRAAMAQFATGAIAGSFQRGMDAFANKKPLDWSDDYR
jgi:enoyl-CoA hydratase/carnithine racemase